MREGKEDEINKKITTEEMEGKTTKAKDKKVPGPDEVTNEMMKEGKEYVKNDLCNIFNEIKEGKREVPESWKLGDIISFFKGKGDPYQMIYQRGITLTSSILKIFESIIGDRIEPVIRRNSTPLQGGGKKGESPEEYIFILQTVIDSNKKERKGTKLIITDVEKAFDQAWRVGVFANLVNRGIKGEILESVWKINNGIKARIKEDTQLHSEEFMAEESIRQGSCLSAILYGQHVASVVEDVQAKDLGKKIGSIRIPAVAWQDDVTLIPSDEEEEEKMVMEFEKSTEKNRIKLAIKKKTMVLEIGKKSTKKSSMKGQIIKETNEAKILGYTFNNEGNCKSHLERKETEVIQMMGRMGMSIKEANMDRILMHSLMIIYNKCFIPKILYGLAGVSLRKADWEHLEIINAKVLKNMLNLPSSTPRMGLYNEMGVLPIKYMLYKRKMGMWWRINREETNVVIRECKQEQINKNLPWGQEIIRIATELDLDLTSVNNKTKEIWKKEVYERIEEKAKEEMVEGIRKLKRYGDIIRDEIILGKRKTYLRYSQKNAKIWSRARMDLLDPAPRNPYNTNNIWKCKFCEAGKQSTEHYVAECQWVEGMFDGKNRREIFGIIQKLEETADIKLGDVSCILSSIYKEIVC